MGDKQDFFETFFGKLAQDDFGGFLFLGHKEYDFAAILQALGERKSPGALSFARFVNKPPIKQWLAKLAQNAITYAFSKVL